MIIQRLNLTIQQVILLAIQIIGLVYNIKTSRQKRVASGYFADMLAHEGEIINLEVFADPDKAKHLYRETVDERIKTLQHEVDVLKQELNSKRAELTRYLKRRSSLQKEE